MAYINYSIDGNQVCATFYDFENLVLSPAGFGDSLRDAFFDLFKNAKTEPSLRDLKPFELKWLNL